MAGLNAAAIIFLYTNFVPRTEYDKLESDFKKAKEELLITKATLDVFRGQMAANYD